MVEIEKTFLYVSFAYLVVVCLENILRSFFFLFYPEGKLYDCAESRITDKYRDPSNYES